MSVEERKGDDNAGVEPLEEGDITVLPPVDPKRAAEIRDRFLKLLNGLASGGRVVEPDKHVFRTDGLHQYFPYQNASPDIQEHALSLTHGELQAQIRILASRFGLDRGNSRDGADVANASMILLIAKSHVLRSLTREIAKVEGIDESVASQLVAGYGPEIDRFFYQVLGMLQGVDSPTDSDKMNMLCVKLFNGFRGLDIEAMRAANDYRIIVDVQEAVERAWMSVLGGVEVTEDMRKNFAARRFLPEAGCIDLQYKYSDLMRFLTNGSNLNVLQKVARRIIRVGNFG